LTRITLLRAGGMAQVVQCLLSTSKVLSSNPCTAKRKKKRITLAKLTVYHIKECYIIFVKKKILIFSILDYFKEWDKPNYKISASVLP
jgi:hypothetical protein